ncbi:hypothetical protein EON83_12395 [bacterium]|nr:MAG: hypothetical protein EON83_12395 [bacterium]
MTQSFYSGFESLRALAASGIVSQIHIARSVSLVGTLSDWSALYADGNFTNHCELEEHIYQSVLATPIPAARVLLTELEARYVLSQSADLCLCITRES